MTSSFSKFLEFLREQKADNQTITASNEIARYAGALASDLSGLTLREDDAGGASDVVVQQFGTAVRLMQRFVDDPAPDRAADYLAGWLRIVALQHPEVFGEFPFPYDKVSRVFKKWQARLGPALPSASRRKLADQLDRVTAQLSTRAERKLRALFVGDCLLWDIATHLQINARAEGYDLEPVLLAKRMGADLRNSLRMIGSDTQDLIFYSPFSFGFSDAYAAYIAPRRAFAHSADTLVALRESVEDVQRSLLLMAQHFDCPIYVHNVSGILQLESGWRGHIADLVTRPKRRRAAELVNGALSVAIDDIISNTSRPILRINELEPLERHSSKDLGRVMFNAGDLHPTALAHQLAAGAYTRACRVAAQLKQRKLVICDLDNTLWDGVIGEGAVSQHADRQSALLRLKAKGVVLAVSSKNDASNVRWEEAKLSPSDFVAIEINWGHKASNIRRIANTLNLNPNSFVFLDDRPDERATVTEELPGILALDPNEPETWTMIEEWTESLGPSALADRTKLYQERMERESYLQRDTVEQESASAAYKKLNLQLDLRRASIKEIGRVVELINRTNQFNTTAARASIAEITNPDVARHILVAEARDRFGDMGIVGALIVTGEHRPEITHFVLSCRVFGFGIETAMIQSALAHFSDNKVRARIVATPVNGPCRQVYAENRFERAGEAWISTSPASELVPDWLSVTDTSSRANA